MGMIRHHAILATTDKTQVAQEFAEYAEAVGAISLLSLNATNGYCTVCIAPDGGNEWRDSSNEGDARRSKLKDWLKERSDNIEWCEVSYGEDFGKARIEDDSSLLGDDIQ